MATHVDLYSRTERVDLQLQRGDRKEGDPVSSLDKPFADLSHRPNLMRVVFSFKMHEKVKEIQIPTVGNREETARYLNGLYHDISLLEGALQQFRLPFSTLPVLYRTEAIRQDREAMHSVIDASYLLQRYDHRGHFEKIARSPHRLLAHFAVHNLGFLSGGQTFVVALSRNFGEEAVHLYRYPEKKPHDLLQKFNEELQQFLEGLSDKEFEEFQAEADLAWIFVCDLFGANVRKTKSCCDCMQRAWSQCTTFVWNNIPSVFVWKWEKKAQ
jgi:hypothetical protein